MLIKRLNEIVNSKDGERHMYKPFILFMTTLMGLTVLEMYDLIMYRTWIICVGMMLIYQIINACWYIKIQLRKLKELES